MRVPSFLRDPLIQGILVATVLAFVLPARGEFADVVGVATKIGIALLFFLYGARLSTREALRGLTHWRLHLVILGFTFVIYPLVGLALRPATPFISEPMYQGILYAMLVPSTVQSSVALTGIARGNISGSVVAASLSSLVGVIATPLLVMLLMGAGGGIHIDGAVFGNVALQLLLPFLLGQIAHNAVPPLRRVAGASATKHVDRGSIWLVVYSAFSQGIVSGVWAHVSLWEIVFLVVLSVLLVYAMLWVTKAISRTLRFSYKDRVAIQMCGTQKSLAAGLPMASVIFGGAALGILIVPLMIYHLIQLMICSAVAARYAREAENTSE
ncbi:bile acid:sodium symporter family protein [Corynebacterium sp. LK2510]|uniref:bile acid:sodium symporter family protein n=1 Tax=Corynebacterium sp. LK2510 TaxID=3110472 RepID=UPI0034CEDC05